MSNIIRVSSKLKAALLGDTPVHFMGAIKQWPALSKWSPGYLKRKMSPSSKGNLFYFDRNKNRIPADNMTAKDALTRAMSKDTTGTPHYLVRQPIFSSAPTLIQDIESPSFITKKHFHDANLWVGQAMTTTMFHYDSTDGYLCQIDGHKRIYLSPPTDSLYMYPRTPLSGGRFNFSRIGGLHNISFEKFPRFFFANLESVLLSPGDSLYIPSGWWHHVVNVTDGIAVNFFYTDEITPETSKQDVLIYQACKTKYDDSQFDNLMYHSDYSNTLETAYSLLKLGFLREAWVFMSIWYEEHIKSQLANECMDQLEKAGSSQVLALARDLHNTRNQKRDTYYTNLLSAHSFLSDTGNSSPSVDKQQLRDWVTLSQITLKDDTLPSKGDLKKQMDSVSNTFKSIKP